MKLYRTPTKVLYLLEMNANYKLREGVQIYCRIQCPMMYTGFAQISAWSADLNVLFLMAASGEGKWAWGSNCIGETGRCWWSSCHSLSGVLSLSPAPPVRPSQPTPRQTAHISTDIPLREREREVWAVFISLIWSLSLGGWQPSSHWLHLTDCLYCSYWGWIISYHVYTAAVGIFSSYCWCLIVYTVYTTDV